MKVLLIADKDYQTETYLSLKELIYSFLENKGHETELIAIGKEDLAFCMGCFGCWVKKPGECVIDDMMSHINHSYNNSDVVIYLNPIIFGQFSANIKNSLDRWIPNILPFFEIRADGSTMHPPRYNTYPKQIIIGYGQNLSKEDLQLFGNITTKHRQNLDVLFYQGDDSSLKEALNKIKLERVGGPL